MSIATFADIRPVLERGRANKLSLATARMTGVEDRAQDRVIDRLEREFDYDVDDDGHCDRSGHVREMR